MVIINGWQATFVPKPPSLGKRGEKGGSVGAAVLCAARGCRARVRVPGAPGLPADAVHVHLPSLTGILPLRGHRARCVLPGKAPADASRLHHPLRQDRAGGGIQGKCEQALGEDGWLVKGTHFQSLPLLMDSRKSRVATPPVI